MNLQLILGNFALILFVAMLITGVIWFLDVFVLAKQRRARADAALAEYDARHARLTADGIKLDNGNRAALEPADSFYLAPFIDYSGPDGMFRKYRIVLIEGLPYICHLAISSHWMVHYLNAGMDDSADKRAEEARAMAAFDTGFALRHAAALADIDRRIGLPYLGIDCAETQDGKLLIFEVDNAMVVHAMDDPARYPYKRPTMDKVFAAFAAMLHRAAGKP